MINYINEKDHKKYIFRWINFEFPSDVELWILSCVDGKFSLKLTTNYRVYLIALFLFELMPDF